MTCPTPSNGDREIIFMWYSQPDSEEAEGSHSAVTRAT